MVVHCFPGEPPLGLCGPEVTRMHEIEDFRQEERELSEMLLNHFQRWKSHICGYLYDEEIKRMDWIDEFCQDAHKGLLYLRCQGRLKNL